MCENRRRVTTLIAFHAALLANQARRASGSPTSHDISVKAETCEKGLATCAGEVVEGGVADGVFNRYTRRLTRFFPNTHDSRVMVSSIRGDPLNLLGLPPGCQFCPRCGEATARCGEEHPEPTPAGSGRDVRCHRDREGA